MDSDDIPQGNGEGFIRVTLSQVILGGERKFFKIFQRFHGININPVFIIQGFVKGNIPVHTVQCRLQPFNLQLFQLLPVHGFIFHVVDHSAPPISVNSL